MKGDPQNQAIVIHYDGWNPNASSSDNSVAAITITHACMSKVNRAESKYARVYSFIPTWQLPKHAPHKLDAFLEPLVTELEDLYIHGQEVFFKKEVDGMVRRCSLKRKWMVFHHLMTLQNFVLCHCCLPQTRRHMQRLAFRMLEAIRAVAGAWFLENMCPNADITTTGTFNSAIGFQLKNERQNKIETTANKFMVPAMPHSKTNYERIME